MWSLICQRSESYFPLSFLLNFCVSFLRTDKTGPYLFKGVLYRRWWRWRRSVEHRNRHRWRGSVFITNENWLLWCFPKWLMIVLVNANKFSLHYRFLFLRPLVTIFKWICNVCLWQCSRRDGREGLSDNRRMTLELWTSFSCSTKNQKKKKREKSLISRGIRIDKSKDLTKLWKIPEDGEAPKPPFCWLRMELFWFDDPAFLVCRMGAAFSGLEFWSIAPLWESFLLALAAPDTVVLRPFFPLLDGLGFVP